jgi:hypothetical protein
MSALVEAVGDGLRSEDRALLEEDLAALSHQMQRIGSRVGRDDAEGS